MNKEESTIRGRSFKDSFESGDFELVRFVNCDFSGSDLSGAGFADCVFESCNFSLTRVSGTRFVGVEFRDCKLAGVGLRSCSQLPLEVAFIGCKIINCDFFGLPLAKTTFTDCELLDCIFERTDLREADFSGSALTGSRFVQSDLRKADFSTARGYAFDLTENRIKGMRLSLPEAANLLRCFDVDLG